MENEHRDDMTEEEARTLIAKCMAVLFCRDKKATDKVQIVTVTKDGVTDHEPMHIDSTWNLEWYTTDSNEKYRPMRIRY